MLHKTKSIYVIMTFWFSNSNGGERWKNLFGIGIRVTLRCLLGMKNELKKQ
jgi:hypothetical protein